MKNVRILAIAVTAVCFAACNGDHTAKSRGPIILGDSSAIVTETDPVALHDQVPDLQPVNASEDAAENAAASSTNTTAAMPATAAPATPASVPAAGNGLTVPFKEVALSIPGITTRGYGNPDLQQARGATYELTGGNLAGAQLRASGGTITKVSQRYETVIILQDDGDKLSLESLGKYASAWQPLSGSGGAYVLAGLEPAKLGYKPATPAAIRNAVQQAARKKRLNRRDTQEWMDAAHNIRAANEPPATVVLRSVSWRIEGKDAGGKSFSKELRVDVPLP